MLTRGACQGTSQHNRALSRSWRPQILHDRHSHVAAFRCRAPCAREIGHRKPSPPYGGERQGRGVAQRHPTPKVETFRCRAPCARQIGHRKPSPPQRGGAGVGFTCGLIRHSPRFPPTPAVSLLEFFLTQTFYSRTCRLAQSAICISVEPPPTFSGRGGSAFTDPLYAARTDSRSRKRVASSATLNAAQRRYMWRTVDKSRRPTVNPALRESPPVHLVFDHSANDQRF